MGEFEINEYRRYKGNLHRFRYIKTHLSLIYLSIYDNIIGE